jgi:hypothetical protein
LLMALLHDLIDPLIVPLEGSIVVHSIPRQ